ncbi:MAG: bifunctional hydroxymethylpyrimidine kinase/phosphomethylpyrimidine kinase [Armatimonadetes bacterium]|nr:bifunctional hydroxymethylpyrimidine kinase/phosphomethylpyrimidine kinase [Armatimonadota bacterium]
MSSPVLIVGSVAIDDVRTPAGERENCLGGAAVYSAVAASFFTGVNLVGVVGSDFPGEYVAFLGERGINLDGLQRAQGQTFRWAGYYEAEDLNQAHSLETRLNVFADFRPDLPESYRDDEFIFLACIDPELQLQVLGQVRSPRLAVCDTRDFWIVGKRDALVEVLKKSDVVIINDGEARLLCETNNNVQAARRILELGPRFVIIKKGEHGAMLFSREAVFAAPSFPLAEVVDPTGAGDTFAGAFTGYLAGSGEISFENMKRAVAWGTVAASFAIQDFSLERMKTLAFEDMRTRYAGLKAIAAFE